MQQAFRRGDRDAGIGVFMDYVFNQMWYQAPDVCRKDVEALFVPHWHPVTPNLRTWTNGIDSRVDCQQLGNHCCIRPFRSVENRNISNQPFDPGLLLFYVLFN